MGHYRSEMGFDEQDRRDAEAKAKRLSNTTVEIQKAIDKDGVAAVLAEIILDTGLGVYIGSRFKRW
jgi:hypothetical protein